MLKIDLSRAFRQLKVDPEDYPLLCLEWQELTTWIQFTHSDTEQEQWGVTI